MLKAMRKNLKSLKPVLWMVVGTFVLAIFAIWGGGQFAGGGQPNVVATVAGEKITSDEYYQSLRQRLQGMQEEFKGLSGDLIQQLNIPQQILEQIIQQRLLLKIGREMGLRASNKEVRERIISYFQRDGQFVGYQEYKQILDYNRMPVREFEKAMEQEVLINKVVQILTAGIAATPEEVWEAYRKTNDSAKIEYLVADKSAIETSGEPAESEILAAFEKNKDAYTIPEKRTADYIFIRGEDLKGEVAVTDAEIGEYYSDNVAQFKEPEKVRASRIFLPFSADERAAVMAQAADLLSRARGGEDFAALARSFSKDDKAPDGGDWGYFDWRSLDVRETEAVAALVAGEISGVIETEGGASILRVTEKTVEITKSLEEVKTTIRGILEDRKTRDLVSQKIQGLERQARREKSLDLAAQKENLKVTSTGPLKKGEGLGDFDASGAVSEALFALEMKAISSPIYTYQGSGLAQLQAVEPERPATLEEVRDTVVQDILDARKDEQAKNMLLAIKAAGKDDWNLEASKKGLEYKTVDAHKREQYLSLIGERPAVDAVVFSLPLKEVGDPLPVESGYAIFRVLERTEVTREDFEKNADAETATFLEQKKNKFLQSYIVKAREEKKVRVNYDLFLRLNTEILSRFTRE